VKWSAIVAAVLLVGVLFVAINYDTVNPIRPKIAEVAALAWACKVSVQEYGVQKNAFPASEREAGCSAEGTTNASGLRVLHGGRIEVTIRNVNRNLDGRLYVLQAAEDEQATQPANSPARVRGWRCGTNAGAHNYKYFPANCRQAD
jgi:type IV pilus assembly protein PilA